MIYGEYCQSVPVSEREDEDDENRRPASDFYKQFMPGAGDGDGH